MLKIKKIALCFILVLLCITKQVSATHIIGGEFTYKYLSLNNYEITLTIYRDCLNGIPPFDNPYVFSIFDPNGSLINNLQIPLKKDTIIAIENYVNQCVLTPTNACLEKGVYSFTVNLPPIIGGYDITYQRCCRPYTVLNIINPGFTGITFTTHIPGIDKVANNNSPNYNKALPYVLCSNQTNNYNYSAIDIDGDSLVYSFTPSLIGLDNCCPLISIPAPVGSCSTTCSSSGSPPPYQNVSYTNPYSSSYQVSSSPVASINSNTGFITINPNLTGDFSFTIEIDEYRNGILINKNFRDIVTKIFNCTICIGLEELNNNLVHIYPNPSHEKITIEGNSYLPTKFIISNILGDVLINNSWDTNSKIIDISSLKEGVYMITLIDNKGIKSIKKIIKN